MSTDTILRIICGILSGILGGIAIVTAGKPEDYGLSSVAWHWLTPLTATLGIIVGGLPGWVKGVAKVAQAAKANGVGER